MANDVRIALQLQHKDDSISENGGSLAFGDFVWDNHRFIHYANGNNEWILLNDVTTNEIDDFIKDVIQVGKKDPVIDPSIMFLYQFDDAGHPTYSADVLNKWKQWIKESKSTTKPYIWNIRDNGLDISVTPLLHEKCVTVSIKLDSDSPEYKHIGELVEDLINKYINIENNLTVRIIGMYDHCMKVCHELHLLDVNQDNDLTKIWGRLIDNAGVFDEVEQWLPQTAMYQKPASRYTVDLSTSDASYLYKYVFENTDPSDKTPVYHTHVLSAKGSPKCSANVLHTSKGICMRSYINKTTITDYIRRDMNPYSGWNNNNSMNFQSNPLVPSDVTLANIGDEDNQINVITGAVSTSFKADVPATAYKQMPWITVDAECYDFQGRRVKTVPGIWDTNNSNKLTLVAGGLAGTFPFTIRLNGYYAVRVVAHVFWGTFGAWSDEVMIARFSVGGSNHSGGVWSVNSYLFDGKKNREITRVNIDSASKYEWDVNIAGQWFHGGGRLSKPVRYSDNARFEVPRGADYQTTSWYGRFLNDDEPAQCVYWDRFNKTRVVDMSGSMHYNGTAKNYGILTSVTLRASYSGLKASYVDDTYHTPTIFNPITKDCTLLLRGGDTYTMFSHCQHFKARQVGQMKVDVGTINCSLENTLYTGYTMSVDNVLLRGSDGNVYKIDVTGNAPKTFKIASSVPNGDVNRSIRRRRSINMDETEITNKPGEETAPGYTTIISLNKYSLHDHPNHIATVTTDNGDIEFRIPSFVVDDVWKLVYNSQGKRAYATLHGNNLIIMTYYMNVKKIVISRRDKNTLALSFKNHTTNDIEMSFKLEDIKPEKYIPVELNGETYYLELADKPSDSKSVCLHDNNSGELIGYLK